MTIQILEKFLMFNNDHTFIIRTSHHLDKENEI